MFLKCVNFLYISTDYHYGLSTLVLKKLIEIGSK